MSYWSEKIKSTSQRLTPLKLLQSACILGELWRLRCCLYLDLDSISLALVGAVLLPCFLVKGRARCGVSKKNIRLDTTRRNWDVQQTAHSTIPEDVQILMLFTSFLVWVRWYFELYQAAQLRLCIQLLVFNDHDALCLRSPPFTQIC